MKLLGVWGTLALLVPALSAHADDARGKELFDQGVIEAGQKHYEAATTAFEASLREGDRPATRYNLVLANLALRRPLEVVRHALAFLDLPGSAAHGSERAQVENLLREASAQLGVLSTEALPPEAELRANGVPPVLRRAGAIYLPPGAYTLEATIDGHVERQTVELSAGQRMPWPRQPVTPDASPPKVSVPDTRVAAVSAKSQGSAVAHVLPLSPPTNEPSERRSWMLATLSLGVGFELAAGGACVAAFLQADELSRGGYGEEGYIPATEAYARTQRAVWPLALGGGLLMSLSLALHEHDGRGPWTVMALGAAGGLLGGGAYLMGREPGSVVSETDLRQPTREAGVLLVSAALPLLVYGVRTLWTSDSKRAPGSALSATSGGLSW